MITRECGLHVQVPGKMVEALAEKGGLATKFKLVTKFATSECVWGFVSDTVNALPMFAI